MWPMQWPSSSKVASVSLTIGINDKNINDNNINDKNINDKKQLTHLLNLLLKQLSGIPLRETVVNGTRQSGIEGNILTVPVLWFV